MKEKKYLSVYPHVKSCDEVLQKIVVCDINFDGYKMRGQWELRGLNYTVPNIW